MVLANQNAKLTGPDQGFLVSRLVPFSYPEPFLRAVNGARRGALAKSISNWHLIGYNEGYCSNNVYILLPCFHGFRFWIWPEPLVAPRVRRALGTRMASSSYESPGNEVVFRLLHMMETHFTKMLTAHSIFKFSPSNFACIMINHCCS